MREAFREGQQPEIVRDTEGQLPELKIYDLLSSVGNGENKALELIVMREGVIYARSPLYQEVMNHQVEGKGWKMARSVPFDHCQKSLSTIGLVTKETLSPDGTAWGYEITQYGLRTGVPFAGLLLKWSYEHPEHSLYKMFGATSSTSVKDEQTLDKKRAPETRDKIFWEIGTNPNSRIRQIDVANEINEDPNIIGVHLRSLSKNGVISYDVTEYGESYSRFKRIETVSHKNPEPYEGRKTLNTRVWNLLSQSMESRPSDYLSVEDIVNSLVQEYPEYEGLQRRSFSGNVRNTLSNLEKQGYVQREKFGVLFHSEVDISDGQREAIVSLVTLIDKFKNGDKQTKDEGRRFAQRVASEPSLFSGLMLKAKEASPYANRTDREETSSFIISIIHEDPNSTWKPIQKVLETRYHKRLTGRSIQRYLSLLVKEEKVIAEKTKAGNVYRVVEEENQTPSAQN